MPTDILPAELGGTGPAFNPGLWAEPVIHSAMKEAELAAAKKGKEHVGDASARVQETTDPRDESETANGNHDHRTSDASCASLQDQAKTLSLNNAGCTTGKRPFGRTSVQTDVELNVINRRRSSSQKETEISTRTDVNDNAKDNSAELVNNGNVEVTCHSDQEKTEQLRDTDDLSFLDAESEINSNEFEIIPSRSGSASSKNSSLDNRSAKAFIVTGNSDAPSEETNLII